MPLSGQPPVYTRGYSFTTHSQQQPNVPQPGDKLDAEFDDIATAQAAGATAVTKITNADGTLKNGIVGQPQLAPGLFNSIVTDAQSQLQPMLDDADDSAAAAAASAAQAASSATDAATSASSAASDAELVKQTGNLAMAAQASAEGAANEAETSAALADNSVSTAQAHMVNAGASSDLSFKWAEYIAGPVEPAPPGWPEAIDDGLWSSKWWALRARQIVGAWGGLYLGAFAGPPMMDPTDPWPPGSLYFDTDMGTMLVWNGSQWVTFSNMPAPSVAVSFVYAATAGQTAFNGPDLQGLTPAIDTNKVQPSDVHVNGVRVLLDNFGGGDYTIDPPTSTLTFHEGLPAGSIVQWDFWLKPSQLAPGSVVAFKLLDLDRDPATNDPGEFDGVRTTFPMRYVDPASQIIKPCTPGDGVQLQVSLDGVMQEFGIDFSSAGSDMVFTDPPAAGTKFWSVWYQPGTPAP